MNIENTPPADTKGTGWIISSNSNRKWFRIERGSREFAEWCSWYRANNRAEFASVISHLGYSFTIGPSPLQHGSAQLAFMSSQNIGG